MKWGMTEQEVIDIYKNKVKSHKDKDAISNCVLIMDNVRVFKDFDDVLDVEFCMDKKTNKLRRVRLSVGPGEGTHLLAEKLRKSLIKKYGKYDMSEIDEDGIRSMMISDEYHWVFPSTTIHLLVSGFGIPGESIYERKYSIDVLYDENIKEDML